MTDNDIIKALEDFAFKDLIVFWHYDKHVNGTPVTIKDILKVINNLKEGTVKEFAERFKEKADANEIWIGGKAYTFYMIREDKLDNLVKEMEGETDV